MIAYLVKTRDVDGSDRRRYKTIGAAVKRFEEMVGYTVQQVVDSNYCGEGAAPSWWNAPFRPVRGVSMFGTVVTIEEVIDPGDVEAACAALIKRIEAGEEFPDASSRVALKYGVTIEQLTEAYDAA